ncbi:MAG: patatin-like phospholipase family protein [Spirochaetota bacterium]
MFNSIEIYAGKNAKRIIQEKGLKADDIKAMSGAAGGPKFLVLNGLDRAVFGELFKNRKEPLFYLGSSIGAFRGAALAQKDPLKALDKLTKSYIKQSYTSKPARREVSAESERIIDDYLDKEAKEYILNRSFVRLNILAAKCEGISSYDKEWLLILFLLNASLSNLISKKIFLKLYKRVMFSDIRDTPPFIEHVKENRFRLELTKSNIRNAILASGAIPYAMEGVKNIKGAPDGTYRDGGVTDYHMDISFGINEGLVLFPHFFSKITPGWFDKALIWRKHNPENFSNTVMVCPSQKFIEKLPGSNIPDRKDFKTFFGNDKERLKNWNYAIKESQRCGDEFLEAVNSGKIKDVLKDF